MYARTGHVQRSIRKFAVGKFSTEAELQLLVTYIGQYKR